MGKARPAGQAWRGAWERVTAGSGTPLWIRTKKDTVRDEYDFSKGVRGRHHEAYRKGTNVVLLEPDVADVFKDSASANRALRTIARLAREQAEKLVGR